MKKGILTGLFFLVCVAFVKAGNIGSCNAGFTYSVSQNVVYFYANDSLANSGSWNFGDGNIDPVGYLTISHTYNASGTYSVLHIVGDSSSGCRDSSLQVIQVSFSPSCAVTIQSQGDSLNPGGPAVYPNHYTFTEQSTIVGSTAKSIVWSIDSSTISSGQSMVYTFPSVGSYKVCVQLSTSSGCVATDCKVITVTNTDSCNLQASFVYGVVSTGNPLSIGFTPSPNDTSLSYTWYFGDGGTSSLENPVHVYPDKGIYYTTLSIKKNYGSNNCMANATNTVYVNIGAADTCTVSISYAAVNPSKPNLIAFTAGTAQPLVTQQWTITSTPDSVNIVTLNENNPSYLFTQAGNYTVALKATTQAGCVNYAYTEVNIDSVAVGSVADSATAGNAYQISSYPNPATNQVSFTVPLTANGTITVSVYSATGTLMRSSQSQGITGSNLVTLPVQGLPSGMYYIQIQNGNTVTRSRFQKL